MRQVSLSEEKRAAITSFLLKKFPPGEPIHGPLPNLSSNRYAIWHTHKAPWQGCDSEQIHALILQPFINDDRPCVVTRLGEIFLPVALRVLDLNTGDIETFGTSLSLEYSEWRHYAGQ